MLEVAPRSKNYMTYEEAILYCQFLEYNGHRDWRMPTRDEYSSNAYHDARVGDWYIDRTVCYASWVTPVRDV
jgi:hypothetical protein